MLTAHDFMRTAMPAVDNYADSFDGSNQTVSDQEIQEHGETGSLQTQCLESNLNVLLGVELVVERQNALPALVNHKRLAASKEAKEVGLDAKHLGGRFGQKAAGHMNS